ncbi:13357_t:CDS:10 [Gigaspora margarita]|uniref:13357_t:CDS:1 n=1 Tax=Gigaspora margarita TaxID=4874 RepID=A0ABN7UB91_GIGMA|nr:13357_t:CDS:10 [Gigaspora margarita]
MYENCQTHMYTPKWRMPCSMCGVQLLPSERKNFCCNSILRNSIPPLRQLPPTLQNLYISNFQENFGHLSRQYNSLFLFSILGYTGGYLINWFVYNAGARNDVANQCKFDQDVVNLIEQELAIVNPFIQACVIVHSTPIVQERCIQIWLDYYHYRIMTEPHFYLLGRLFNKYLVDMFSRADDEQLQFIRREQYRFRKDGQEEDESLSDEAGLRPDENTVIDEMGYVYYQRCTDNDINVVPYNAFLLLKLNSHINVEVASTSHVISYLYKYIYKGPDCAIVNIHMEENEPEIIDEINDYLNAYEQIIVHGNKNNNLSMLQRYFLHLINSEFNNLTYCEYNELYNFKYIEQSFDRNKLLPDTYLEERLEGYRQCIVKPYKQNHIHITRMNIICPSVDLRTVNNILHTTFQDAARALGLLEKTTEYKQCFSEAISYNCTLAQLCLLFCRLIIEGMAAQNMWQNYREQLLADYTSKHANMQGENEALTWITDFLEEHGIKITQMGLPQPPNRLSEITRIKLQYSNYEELITKQEEMISKLNSEQKNISESHQAKCEHQEHIMNIHFIKIIDPKVSDYKSDRQIRKDKREMISNGTVKDKATQIKNGVITVKSISKGVKETRNISMGAKIDRIEMKSEDIPDLNRHKILGCVSEVVDAKTACSEATEDAGIAK